jgi:hypothetical protein
MLALRWLVPVLALLVLAAEVARASEAIRISYTWIGLGPGRTESYEIVRDGDHYKAEAVTTTSAFGSSGDRDRLERSSYNVSAASVEALIEALREPPMTKGDALAALTKPAWLRDHAAQAYASITTKPCADSARQLFYDRFQNTTIVRAALDKYFTGMWTDDYPSASIEVDLPQTGKVVRGTSSQKAFMLPWRSGEREDWNPALGPAVAALLPQSSAGKGRLLGSNLVSRLADYVLMDARDEWGDLEERCVFRDAIAKLDPPFRVVGIYRSSGSFNSYLQSADMPANLALNAILPSGGDGKVEADEIEALLRLGPIYVRQVRAFALEHPHTKVAIWYSGRHSFDARDLDDPHDPALNSLCAVAADCVMLREHDYMYGRRWVVPPNGEAILFAERPTWDSRRPGSGW